MRRPKTLKEYRVAWEIELSATSHLDAARKALAAQRDPLSIATVFEVYQLPKGDMDAARMAAVYEPVAIDLGKRYGRRRGK